VIALFLCSTRKASPSDPSIKRRPPCVCPRRLRRLAVSFSIGRWASHTTALRLPQSDSLQRCERPLLLTSIPAYGEALGISIKDEPFTSDQSNFQEIQITFADWSGNPINKRMTFQTSLPDGREILPFSHHVRAVARKIDCSFAAHANSLDHASATDLIEIKLFDPTGSSKCSDEFRARGVMTALISSGEGALEHESTRLSNGADANRQLPPLRAETEQRGHASACACARIQYSPA
jgi:hypothetical protein